MKCPVCRKEVSKNEMWICNGCGRAVCIECFENVQVENDVEHYCGDSACQKKLLDIRN